MAKKVKRFISERDESNIIEMGYELEYYNTEFGNVLVIKNVKINNAYHNNKVDIAIKVIYGYDGKALFDMFWNYPYLYFIYENIGIPPRKSILADITIDDIQWQRWSRHYSEATNQPINVVQHLSWIITQIEQEVKEWKAFKR